MCSFIHVVLRDHVGICLCRYVCGVGVKSWLFLLGYMTLYLFHG